MRITQSGFPTDFLEGVPCWKQDKENKTYFSKVGQEIFANRNRERPSDRFLKKGKHSVCDQGDKRSGLNVGLG